MSKKNKELYKGVAGKPNYVGFKALYDDLLKKVGADKSKYRNWIRSEFYRDL